MSHQKQVTGKFQRNQSIERQLQCDVDRCEGRPPKNTLNPAEPAAQYQAAGSADHLKGICRCPGTRHAGQRSQRPVIVLGFVRFIFRAGHKVSTRPATHERQNSASSVRNLPGVSTCPDCIFPAQKTTVRSAYRSHRNTLRAASHDHRLI